MHKSISLLPARFFLLDDMFLFSIKVEFSLFTEVNHSKCPSGDFFFSQDTIALKYTNYEAIFFVVA